MRPRRNIVASSILTLAFSLSSVALPIWAAKNPPAKPIDLNTATIQQLEELPGVGAVTAQRILDMRQKSGPFHRVEDLLAVRGIGEKRLARIRPYITVVAPRPPAAVH